MPRKAVGNERWAFNQLNAGQKVRNVSWEPGVYMYTGRKDNALHFFYGDGSDCGVLVEDWFCDTLFKNSDWEIYVEE